MHDRTIAVLPFVDADGAGSETWFTRGFAEDLVTELGRFAALEVVHPHSSFHVDAPLSDRALASDLGAAYLVRGSVRRSGDALLVSARLVEAASGRQAWAERFEVSAHEAPAVQIDIACRIAGALAIEIDRRKLSGARARRVEQLEAYECWLRGSEELRRGSAQTDVSARALFTRALAIEPHFARAHAGLSLSYFNEWSCQAWESWDETQARAFEHARHALALDDSDHVVHVILGRVYLYRRQFDAAERHLDLAHDLNPNDADALVQIALGRTYLGDVERALACLDKALRLNPKHESWYFAFAAYVYFYARRYDDALRCAGLAGPLAVDLPAFAAASHAYLGDPVRARECVAEFAQHFRERVTFGREPEPGEPLRWLRHVSPHRRNADAEHFERGLALAGLVPDPDASVRVHADARDDSACLRREGDVWLARFRGESVRLQPVKGFVDLAHLISRAPERVHCLELANRPIPGDRADRVLDAQARRALEQRVRDLQDELDQARENHDIGHAERAQEELERVAQALSSALGIGGRSRVLGSAVEKARSAVTWRIRSAIEKVATSHPALGRHLASSIRTGTYCAYEPESPVRWED